MDLEKIKNFDFQNIDLSKIDINKIVEGILVKKDLFASLVIGAVAFMIAIALTRNFYAQAKEINHDIDELKVKIETITRHDDVQKKLNTFFKALPAPMDGDLLSITLTDLAAENNVNVKSYVPYPDKSEDLNDVVSAAIDVEAKDYVSLIKFLKAVEEVPYALRVDSCSMTPAGTDRTIQQDHQERNNEKIIRAHMEFSSLGLKK